MLLGAGLGIGRIVLAVAPDFGKSAFGSVVMMAFGVSVLAGLVLAIPAAIWGRPPWRLIAVVLALLTVVSSLVFFD